MTNHNLEPTTSTHEQLLTPKPPTWLESYLHFLFQTYAILREITTLNFVSKLVGLPIVILWAIANYILPSKYYFMSIIWICCGLYIVPILVVIFCIAPIFSKKFIINRQSAFDSAKFVLKERINQKRAIRFDDYDVFLPTSTTNVYGTTTTTTTATANTINKGFLFFPGALVEHTAYAPMAAQLSDKGILVVVLSFEPYRTPSVHHKSNFIGYISKILESVNVLVDNSNTSIIEKRSKKIDWSVGGHSMGSSAAYNLIVHYLNHNKQQFSKSLSSFVLSKLILVGGSTSGEKFGSLKHSPIQVLTIDGSNDMLIKSFVSPSKQAEFFETKLPPLKEEEETTTRREYYTQKIIIDGGNHSGFGYYGPQTFPIQDGQRTISLQSQQKQLVQAITEFLLVSSSSSSSSESESIQQHQPEVPLPETTSETQQKKKD